MPMTLWSVLKTYFLMNPVGASGTCTVWPCADILNPPGLESLPAILQKGGKIFLGDHIQIRVHLGVAQAAQLCANDLVMADLFSLKAHWDDQSRYRVLLQAQFTHEETVNHILTSHQEFDLLIHRDGQRRNDDVVGTSRIG